MCRALRWSVLSLFLAFSHAAWAWEVHWDTDDGADNCVLGNTYEDGTVVMFMQDQHLFDRDEIALFLFNDGWSLEPGDEVGKITIETREWDYWDEEPVALEGGLMMTFAMRDISSFFTSVGGFRISRNATEIGTFSASGLSTAYLLDWHKCIRPREQAKREKERQDYIDSLPRDPFAD